MAFMQETHCWHEADRVPLISKGFSKGLHLQDVSDYLHCVFMTAEIQGAFSLTEEVIWSRCGGSCQKTLFPEEGRKRVVMFFLFCENLLEQQPRCRIAF